MELRFWIGLPVIFAGLVRLQGTALDPAAFEGDDSLEIHCCHGPLRELEILRDRLLDAFHRDPTLRPDDVVLLVPEIEGWASFVDAAFGAVRREAPHDVK